jgi:ATP-binding cassette subfamily F protein 3
MDEPTNHLDLDSSEALIDALTGYDGTLLFVSHNRSFVNGLATHVWEVRDGTVDAQPGDLDDWEARRAAAAEQPGPAAHPAQPRPRADARRERAKERERRAQRSGRCANESRSSRPTSTSSRRKRSAPRRSWPIRPCSPTP